MNFMDLVYIVLLLGGLAMGFFQGTIRLLVAIISFYVGIVLASLYFQSAGTFFQRNFRTSAEVGQITAFAVIMLVAFLLLTAAGLYTFRYAKFPAGLDFVDRVAGTVLGLVMGALFMGMLAVLLSRLFISQDTANAINLPIMRSFQNSVRGSSLNTLFATEILPLIYNLVRPALPESANFIFRI